MGQLFCHSSLNLGKSEIGQPDDCPIFIMNKVAPYLTCPCGKKYFSELDLYKSTYPYGVIKHPQTEAYVELRKCVECKEPHYIALDFYY